MRTVRFERFGAPADVLAVEDVPVPEPATGEVRVRVLASPINEVDLLVVEGAYPLRGSARTPGNQAAGEIDALGPGVDLTLGEHVVFRAPGTWQEYVIVPAAAVAPIPSGLPFDIASMAYLGLTASALLDEAPLAGAEWLLLTAAGSMVARCLAQLARRRGLKPLCVARGATAARLVGAEEVIDTDRTDPVTRAAEITHGRGVSVVFDAVSGRLAAQAIETLAPGGTMIVYGCFNREDIPVSATSLITRDVDLWGFSFDRWTRQVAAPTRAAMLAEVLKRMAAGDVYMPVEARYPLGRVREAAAHARVRGRSGKVILTAD